jgi:endonuclease VIII
MPEIAEVRRMTQGLRQRIQGKRLVAVELLPTGKYVKKGPPKRFDDFVAKLPQTVEGVRSKGKKTIIQLSNDVYLIMGYGMTGSLSEKPDAHSVYALVTDDGSRYYFSDQRPFACLHVFPTKADFVKGEKMYAKGADLLEQNLSLEDWTKLVRNPRRKKTNLVKFLRDQQAIGGIGNYLCAEILFEARLSPKHTLESLTDVHIAKLKAATELKVKEAYAANGKTIKDYHDFEGNKGFFECKVYGQSLYEGHKIRSDEVYYGDQYMHWCPDLQNSYQGDYVPKKVSPKAEKAAKTRSPKAVKSTEPKQTTLKCA